MGAYVYTLFVVALFALMASKAVSSNVGPQFECSSSPIVVTIEDTTPIGTVVLKGNITELSACDHLELNISQGALVLTQSLTEKCEATYVCAFKCGQQASNIIFIITRTIFYNVSFDNDTFFASIAENLISGTHLPLGINGRGVGFHATGCDTNTYFFTAKLSMLEKNFPFEWFAETNQNALRSKGTIDFDIGPRDYYLTLKGEYAEVNGSATATILVRVTDEDDQSPRFNITDGNEYILEIPEGNTAIVNTPLTTVPPVQAYDADLGINALVHYRIKTITPSHTPSDLFTIDLTHGTFNVTRELDFETQPQYRVIIEAFQVNNPQSRTTQAFVLVVVKDMTSSVPLNTPLQKEQITSKKETFERGISEILNKSVVISSVDSYDKSPHRSRIVITATDKSVETITLVRMVFNNYEEIRSLFYSALENADTKASQSDLGASEIGLIVMAVVIVVETSITIVFIHRQYNSHKRLKKVCDTPKKDSSIHGSQ